jgi:hypothetical protein
MPCWTRPLPGSISSGETGLQMPLCGACGSAGRKKKPGSALGRIAKGCDCLGYHFRPGCVTVATKMLAHCVARVHQPYEREREKPFGSSTLGAYMRLWVRWVRAGLPCDASRRNALCGTRPRPTCPCARASRASTGAARPCPRLGRKAYESDGEWVRDVARRVLACRHPCVCSVWVRI